jgi:hypothetical protein
LDWLDYLKEAKAESHGRALVCKDSEAADSAKRQLYSARAKAREEGDKSFDDLSISQSPHSDHILLIYHRKEAEDAPQSTGAES